MAATVSVVLGGLMIVCVACFVWRKKRTRHNDTVDGEWHDESNKWEEELELTQLDLATVMVATDNFKLENKLGEGGFGPVFKGKLMEVQGIAVKRLSKTLIQGTDEFKNKVTLIVMLLHRNLVRLLGCCIHAEEMMLIYEYKQNKTWIASYLIKPMEYIWIVRFDTISSWTLCKVFSTFTKTRDSETYTDLKANNILLDKEVNLKISDFGMARIFGSDGAITKTRRVVETYGYMSPDYIMDGIFSVI